MINLVLFGPPGSGKGTQAALLVEKYGIEHLSTGEVIRAEIRRGTPLGSSVQAFIERGQLAPDALVVSLIESYLSGHQDVKGVIFDGFPRTIPQAEAFDGMLAAHGEAVTLMVSLDVPDDELVERILLRGRQSGRADDADIEVIRNRIRIYKEQTAVVADHYAGQNKYFPVDGQGTIDAVFERIARVLDEKI